MAPSDRPLHGHRATRVCCIGQYWVTFKRSDGLIDNGTDQKASRSVRISNWPKKPGPDDSPPVKVPKAESQMLKYGKSWWTLVVIQCTAVSLVLGAYYGIKTNIIALNRDINSIKQRVGVVEKSLKNPALLPASRGSSEAVTIKSATPNTYPSDHVRVADNIEQPSKGTNSLPESEKPREPTACVNKMTHAIFACEKATKCLGPNNFDATYFRNIRIKLRLGDSDWMMICDERPAETAPPASEAK